MHKITLPAWARARAAHSFHTLDLTRTALINIDMQRAFLDEGQVFANPHARDIVANIVALSAAMRRAGGKVAWTRQTFTDIAPFAPPAWHYDPDDPHVARAKASLRAGASGHSLGDYLRAQASDAIIDKYRYGALMCPAGGLQSWLEANALDTMIISGTLTNCCCESTARDAHMLGMRVFFVEDATAARTDEEHNAALLNLTLFFADVRSTASMLALIGAAQDRSADTVR